MPARDVASTARARLLRLAASHGEEQVLDSVGSFDFGPRVDPADVRFRGIAIRFTQRSAPIIPASDSCRLEPIGSLSCPACVTRG